MTSELTLSLKIKTEAAQARDALRDLINQVRESGRAASDAEREAIRAARDRARETRAVARAHKDMETLGVRSTRSIRDEMARVEAALGRLRRSSATTGTDMARATDAARRKMAELKAELSGTSDKSGVLAGIWGRMTGLFAGFQALRGAGAILTMADDMQRLNGRLMASEGSAGAARRGLESIKKIAQETHTPIDAVGNAYVRFSRTIKGIGGTQQQAARLTDLLTKALKLSGASAAEAGNTMLQLGQAFESGRLSGDEFRSVAENGGMVLDYLAKALGISRGELRKMSMEGKLTSDVLLRLLDAGQEIDEAYSKLPRTLQDFRTDLSNAFATLANESTVVRVALRALGLVLKFVAENLGKLISTAIIVGIAAMIIKVGGLTAAFVALVGVIKAAAAALGGLIASNPYLLAGAVAIMGLVWAWDKLVAAWEYFFGQNPEKQLVRQTEAFESLGGAMGKIESAVRSVSSTIDTAIQDTSQPIKNLVDSYKTAAVQIKDSLDTQLKAISDNAKERQRIAGQSGLSERDLIREQARIVMEAEQQKVDAIRLAGEQMDAAWQQTYGRAIELARTAGQDTAKLEQEATDAKIASYKMQEDAYKATIDALVAEEKRHLDAVREIENQRYLLKLSTEDRIRALRQRAMSDIEAYQDRNKQYEEKMAKAQEELAKGNYERARKFADEAMRIAERNAQEVTRTVEAGGKKTQETVVSLQQATETASGQIEAAAKVADQAWEQAGKTEADTVSRIQGEMSDAKKALDEVKAKLDEINAAQQNAIALKIEADTHEADASIERLKQLVTAQALVAKVETDLREAQKTLDAWRADPQNKELALSAKVDQAILDTTLANLRDAMQAADLQAPAGLDTTPAKAAFEGLVKTLNETKTTSTHTVEDDVPETLGNLEKLNKRDTKSTHTVGSNAPAVRKEIDQLKKNTSSTHTIYVRKVPAGGGSGSSEPAPQKRASGGWVQAFASGGRAWRRMVGHISGPGTGTSDSIRALLSNGEFVLRERASRLAAQALPGFLERLNAISSRADLHALLSAVVNAGLPPVPRFSTGGYAVPASMPSSSESLTVTFRAGDMEAPVRVTDPDSRQMLKDVVRELGRLGLIAGRSA